MTDEIEEQYRTLYENALVGLWTSIIKDGKFIRANDTAAKIAGYEDAEELMNNCTAIKLFDYETRVEFIRELREHGVKSGFEAVLIDKKGNEKEISVSGKIDQEKGTIEGLFIDISDWKKTQKALRESEEKYRNIINNIREGYFEVDLKGNFILCNERMCEFLGYTRDELLCMNYHNIVINENKELVYNKFNSVYKNESPQDIIEFEIQGKDSKKSFIESSVSLKFNSNGEKIGFFGVARDITEKKEAEHKLKESEIKYRHLFESSPFIIGLLDLEGKIIDLNTTTNQFLTTRTKGDLIGKNISEIFSLHEKERPIISILKEHIIRMLKGEITESFEVPFYRTNGSIQWGRFQGSLIKIEDENLIQFIIQDITEMKKAEQELKESEEKFRTITEQSLMGIAIFQDNVVKYVNEQFADLYGYDVKEIKNWGPDVLIKTIHPEDRDMVMKHVELRQKGLYDDINHYFYRAINKTGETIWFEVYAKTIIYKGRTADLVTIVNITETREAEEMLRESEEKYRKIIENIREGYFEVDLKGNLTFFNKALCKWSGFSSEELLGMNFSKFMSEDDAKRTYKVFHQIFLSEILQTSFQYEFINRDGKKFYGESSIYLRYDSYSNKIGFSGFMRDITEKREAEQKLRESEEKFKNMINNLDLGFYQVKWDGTFLNVNPEFRRMRGYGQFEDLSEKNIKDFWRNPEDQKKYTKELLKNNAVDNYIGHGLNINGEELILQTNSHLIRDDNGKPIRVEGTVADITEKFKLEQKLKHSEERYCYLFENSPLAIILADFKGIIRDMNPATETLIGYKKEELIGRTFTNVSLVHPDQLTKILKSFQFNTEGVQQPPLDLQFYHKDGRLIWANIIPIVTKIGNERFIEVLAIDITERKKAELLIKEELQKLKELDQIRKDLISRVSHELKTPLIPVMGGAELLLYSYKDQFEKEPLEIIEMIEKGGKRLAKLVEKLLDITKIEYDKFELEIQRTNLGEIVRVAVRDMKYLIEEREINLFLVVPNDIYAELDGFRIEQVVTNLLSNAIKNTPPKGRISVMLEKYSNWAIISVSDTGVGFTEEETKKVFTKFGKFERYGEGLEYIDMKGSGLGLYISKQIVDLHKGKIWVESTGRNRGCIFKVRLPIK